MKTLKLYSFFNSSAAYRVRIALNLKQLKYEYKAVSLVKDGGEQHKLEYRALNPMAEIPTLMVGDQALSQSMAILLYLDDVHPEPLLFSKDPFQKAKIIQFCEAINSGIHPIQNLKVRQELEKRYSQSADQVQAWCAHWVQKGFVAIEEMLKTTAGQFCFGNQMTAADAFLVPQVFNARRFKVDLKPFPLISRVEENCLKQKAFELAHPSAQPDYKP